MPASIATRPLRIAQVAPLHESVPPALYGGTERIVHYLTEALVELGHDVTLFASGDSRSSARLVAPCARALRLDGCTDSLAYHYTMLESVYRRSHEFDLVHFHIDYLHFPATRRIQLKHVTTLHGRLDLPELGPLYAEYSEMPVVSISRSQRTPLPEACWVGNVPHGLPLDQHAAGAGGDYLAFLGRVSPEKGLERAIEIAERTHLTLRVAAKIDRADRAYYEDRIAPRFKSRYVDFIGEIDDTQKTAFLGNARALVFPIDWPEPFGLVMIEAMACGTPVIAWRNGSVPEVIDDGVTGTLVSSLDAAVAAVGAIDDLPRDAVRARFEQRFGSLRMARDYVDLYRQLTFLGDDLGDHGDDDARDRSGDPGLLHPGYRVARG